MTSVTLGAALVAVNLNKYEQSWRNASWNSAQVQLECYLSSILRFCIRKKMVGSSVKVQTHEFSLL